MDFSQKYSELLKKAENTMNEYVKVIDPINLYEPFSYLINGGGKRIRPCLAMISCGAVGADPEDAINCAVAIEILHNYTLAHDDIMDQSPMRRGRPTVHTKWDEATAILVGDVMIGHAYRLLPPASAHERSEQINLSFTKAMIEVCEGQAYDMDFNEKVDITMDDYFLMIKKKTSSLLETAAVMGAHCGEATAEQVEAINQYAYALGIAFQLQDDLLDLTADEAELGKTIGLDIVEGKKTFMILHAKEHIKNDDDKKLMDKFYENNGLPKEYIPKMRVMLEKAGSVQASQEEVEKYFNIAKDSIKVLPNNDYKKMLDWLIDKLNKRSY